MEERQKQRVAVYCRSGHEKSDDHLQFQVGSILYLIQRNPDWELKEVYGDFGIDGCPSGAKLSLHRLMKDCKNGDVDIVLFKALSRLTRDVPKACRYIRDLHKMGVRVVLEREGIDTGRPSDLKLLSVIEQIS